MDPNSLSQIRHERLFHKQYPLAGKHSVFESNISHIHYAMNTTIIRQHCVLLSMLFFRASGV